MQIAKGEIKGNVIKDKGKKRKCKIRTNKRKKWKKEMINKRENRTKVGHKKMKKREEERKNI